MKRNEKALATRVRGQWELMHLAYFLNTLTCICVALDCQAIMSVTPMPLTGLAYVLLDTLAVTANALKVIGFLRSFIFPTGLLTGH